MLREIFKKEKCISYNLYINISLASLMILIFDFIRTETKFYYSSFISCCIQTENFITRPLSCEGPSDSGISVTSDYICPDETTILNPLNPLSQSVSWNQIGNCVRPSNFIFILMCIFWQDIESHRVKRGHVLAELLDSERIYVNEMKSILTVGIKQTFLYSKQTNQWAWNFIIEHGNAGKSLLLLFTQLSQNQYRHS